MHYHSELNDKIELMVAMAPVATGAKNFFPLQIPLQVYPLPVNQIISVYSMLIVIV